MRANLGAGMQAGAPTAQASGAVAGYMPTSGAYPLWAQVVGTWNELDDDGNAAKVKSDTAGLFLGADTAVGQGWRLGAALGFTDGSSAERRGGKGWYSSCITRGAHEH